MNNNYYNILIVDDDRTIRDFLEDSLKDKGYEVETNGDGTEAIDRIKAKKFDIVIVDLLMPKMSGMEVLKAIKHIDPDVIVIIMTGYTSMDTAIQAIREGAYDYITKPFHIEEMCISIKNACEKVFLRRQNRTFVEEMRRLHKDKL